MPAHLVFRITLIQHAIRMHTLSLMLECAIAHWRALEREFDFSNSLFNETPHPSIARLRQYRRDSERYRMLINDIADVTDCWRAQSESAQRAAYARLRTRRGEW